MKNTKANDKEGPFERGPVARVYHPDKTPCAGKPLRFWRLINGKEKSSWHALDEIHELNATARKMNESAQTHGERFAIPTDDEIEAVRIYRRFCEAQKKAGKNTPSFADMIASAIAREQTLRDATPTISEVATEYIAAKQRTKKLSSVHIKSLTQIFKFFSENFKDKKLADFTVDAVTKAIESKPELKNPNSQRAYYSNIRALFSWWYKRENKSRRPAERLTNPLENLDVPKLQKTEKPKPISSETLRRYLNLVREKKPELLPAVVLQAFCGLRRTDVMKLKWSDIVGGFVFLTPEILGEDNFHAVPLPPCAMTWLNLAESKEPDSFIAFPELTGRDRIEKALTAKTNFDAKCGINLRRDTLRHSAIINLSMLFNSTIAAQICWLNKRTFDVYHHIVSTLNRDKALAEANNWFSVFPPKVEPSPSHLFEFRDRVKAFEVSPYRSKYDLFYATELEFYFRAIHRLRLDPRKLRNVSHKYPLSNEELDRTLIVSYLPDPDENAENINKALDAVADSLVADGWVERIKTKDTDFGFRALKVAGA